MIEVVCAVVVRGAKVMLCRRPAGSHLAGDWEFPGGKVEAGEGAREALAREIREELGCEVEVGESLVSVEHRYPEVAIRLQPFVCTIVRSEPKSLEHEEIGWFGAEEIERLGLAGADREVWRAMKAQGSILEGRGGQ